MFFTMPGDARPSLEPGGQRVTHAGDQEPRRCLGDHLGVDQDQVGILAVEAVFLENPFFSVNDGKGTAGGVAGGDRGAIDHGQTKIGGSRASRIEDLATSGADDRPRLAARGRTALTRSISASEHSPPKRWTACFSPASSRLALPGLRQQADDGLAGDDQDRPFKPQGRHLRPSAAVAPLPWVYRLGEEKTVSIAQFLSCNSVQLKSASNEVAPSLHPGPLTWVYKQEGYP